MANIIRRPGWHIPEKLVTPEPVYENRRRFLRQLGFAGGGLLSAGLVSCSKSGSQADAAPAGTAAAQQSGIVVFPDAGVSIDVGEGWKRIDKNPGLPVCPPMLVGPSGVVRALLFAPSVSDMQAATNAVWSRFDGDSDAVKDSYHQEAFTTDSGLRGQHITYIDRATTDGAVTQMWCHSFIIQRKDGRFVTISCIGATSADPPSIQMIQKSLRLQ